MPYIFLVKEPREFNRRQMGPLIFMDVPRGKFHAESIWLGAIDAQGSHHPQNDDFKMAAVANLKIHNIKQKKIEKFLMAQTACMSIQGMNKQSNKFL